MSLLVTISVAFFALSNFFSLKVEASSNTINFQSKIVFKSTGLNITSGVSAPSCISGGADTCDFQMRIYTVSSAGSAIYTETFANVEIGDTNGIFNLQLNSLCGATQSGNYSWGPVSNGNCTIGTGVDFSQNLYYEFSFDPDGDGDFAENENFPDSGTRPALRRVPSAYYAQIAGGVVSDSLDYDDFEDTMDLDANLTTNQGNFSSTYNFTGTATAFTYNANSVNTSDAMQYSFNGLTSGNGMIVSSSSTSLTGNLFSLNSTGNSSTTNGNLLYINVFGANNRANGIHIDTSGSSFGNAIRIINTGSSDSLRIDDVASDTTPFVLDASGNLSVGGNIATSGTSIDLLNTTATTINFGGAATTFNIGQATSATLNIGAGSTTATTINLAGGSGASGCTVTGSSGAFACSSSGTFSTSLISGTSSFNLINTTATTINFGGAATTFNIGQAASATLNIGAGSTTATTINLAGGSGATGCTIDGATGNISCSGKINIGGSTPSQVYGAVLGGTVTKTEPDSGPYGLIVNHTLSGDVLGNGSLRGVNINNTITNAGHDGTYYTALYLENPTGSASEGNRGLYVDSGYYIGITSMSPVYFDSTLNVNNTFTLSSGNAKLGTTTNTAFLNIAQATSAQASLRLVSSAGTNPSSPNSGDLWWNGTNLNFRTASGTVDLLSPGGSYIVLGPASDQSYTGSNVLINLNETGGSTPNLINLAVGGSSRLSLTNAGLLTIADDIALNGGDLTTTQTTASIFNTTATTINFGGAATSVSIGVGSNTSGTISFLGGSGATGCSMTGNDGALTCSGTITGNSGLTISGNTASINASSNFGVNIATGTSTGAVDIGVGASTQTIRIGYHTADANKTLTLGNLNGTSATTNLYGGGGGLFIQNTIGAINIGTVTSSGVVNIGTASSSAATINIGTGTSAQTLEFGTGAGAKLVNLGSNTTGSITTIYTGDSTNTSFRLVGLTNVSRGQYICYAPANTFTNYNTSCGSSSIRYKENIFNLSYGLEEIMALRPVFFNYKADQQMGTDRKIGFIAEEVNQIIPEVTVFDSNGLVESLDYEKLVSLLTIGVQQLNTNLQMYRADTDNQLSSLRVTVEDGFLAHQLRIDALETRVQSIEAGVFSEFMLPNTATFQEAILTGKLRVDGQLILSNKNIGTASIEAGQTEVTITFGTSFPAVPVVIVTPINAYLEYFVKDISANSFKISINQQQLQNTDFNWFVSSTDN